MNLADYQQAMLALIVTDESPAEPSTGNGYLESVQGSTALAVVRQIGDSWRRFSIQRLCPLTWRLAEQRGRLDDHFSRLSRTRGLSPFLSILARQFLDQLSASDDNLDAAVAQFEYALLAATDRAGSTDEVVIDWPRDPEELLTRLVAGEAIGEVRPGHYRTRAAAASPTSFTIQLLAGDVGRRS